MPKKERTKPRRIGPVADDWFLQEWMTTLNLRQADMCRETGLPKPTMNAIYHGKTNYYRDLVNLLSGALGIHPYELLMHPDEALAIRQFRSSAFRVASVQIAADNSLAWVPEPPMLPGFDKKG